MNTRYWGRVAVAALALPSLVNAQITFQQESMLGSLPIDVAVSPDGAWAVVRAESGTSQDAISGWDLTTGARFDPLFSPPQAGTHTLNLTRAPSDLIAAGNHRVVAIGSNGTDTTGYIDVLRVNSGGGTITSRYIANLVVSGSTPMTVGGRTNDVSITPNGAFAVTNQQNYIHVVELTQGTTTAFNIGSFAAGPCDPNAAVDSVETTNRKAVVLTNRPGLNNQIDTWVYVLNLTVSGPSIALETNLGAGEAHDLAITPDGTRAVVTTDGRVALIDLNTNAVTVRVDSARRTYGQQLDSVEVNDSQALVIGTFEHLVGMTVFRYWRVWTYDITSPSFLPLDERTGHINGDYPRDLTLTPDGTRGVVRTRFTVLVYPDLSAPNPTLFLQQEQFSNSGVSDCVVANDYAAATTGYNLGNGQAYVAMFDLTGATIPAPTVDNFAAGADDSDLTLSRDGQILVVRTDDGDDTNAGSPGATDIVLYNMVPFVNAIGTQLASFGATGDLFALDMVEAGASRVISISEVAIPPTFLVGNGFLQILEF